MRYFPIFLDTRGTPVLVVGGGEVAVPKLRLLLKTEAAITVVARTPAPELTQWAEAGRLTLLRRPFVAADAREQRLVYAATGDRSVDLAVKAAGEAAGVLVNVVDSQGDCQFLTAALVDRDPVTIAIGTEGTAPVLARHLKAEIEALADPQLGQLARAASEARAAAEALPPGGPRRDFWQAWFTDVGPRALSQHGVEGLRPALDGLLAQHLSTKAEPHPVALVGAGPGDPELMTLKARKRLAGADIVIHDQLVTPAILELARREAEVINVGKTGFGPSWSQSAINQLLVEKAQTGARVVRLKGGDPGVFGRADEESAALREAGLEIEIVPGITAASAAAAAAGFSLTRRGRNASLQILTGHDAQGFAEQDWASLARPGAAAAVYMGVRAAPFLTAHLLAAGADPAKPVTIVERASRPDQRLIDTTLGQLLVTLAAAPLAGPAILFFGLARAQTQQALRPPTVEQAHRTLLEVA